VLLISVPVGVFGTLWAHLKLEERSDPVDACRWARQDLCRRPDLPDGRRHLRNRPCGGHATGWTSPKVLGPFAASMVLLVDFVNTGSRVSDPMFRLLLFRIHAFTSGHCRRFLGGARRG
jgi:hypothetical protein